MVWTPLWNTLPIVHVFRDVIFIVRSGLSEIYREKEIITLSRRLRTNGSRIDVVLSKGKVRKHENLVAGTYLFLN